MSAALSTREALAKALLHVQHPDNPDAPLPMVRAGCAGILADALLASPVLVQIVADARAEALRKSSGRYLTVAATAARGAYHDDPEVLSQRLTTVAVRLKALVDEDRTPNESGER